MYGQLLGHHVVAVDVHYDARRVNKQALPVVVSLAEFDAKRNEDGYGLLNVGAHAADGRFFKLCPQGARND